MINSVSSTRTVELASGMRVLVAMTIEIDRSKDGVVTVNWVDVPEKHFETIARGSIKTGIHEGLVFEGCLLYYFEVEVTPRLTLSVSLDSMSDSEVVELGHHLRRLAKALTRKVQKTAVLPPTKKDGA
jgi:hypothetical protein